MSIKLNLLRMTLKSRVITIFAVQSPPSNAEVKEWVGLYLHFPNTPLWGGAELKHRDNFTFTFTFTYNLRIKADQWMDKKSNVEWSIGGFKNMSQTVDYAAQHFTVWCDIGWREWKGWGGGWGDGHCAVNSSQLLRFIMEIITSRPTTPLLLLE